MLRAAVQSLRPRRHCGHLMYARRLDVRDFVTLDGLAVSEMWRESLARAAEKVAKQLGRPACLSVVQIGNRPESLLYVSKKREACEQVGIANVLKHLPESTPLQEAQRVVRELSAAPEVDGILLQLPVPSHLDDAAIIDMISPVKDVDGLHPETVGKLVSQASAALYKPCTALGCMQLLERHGISVRGLNAVVLGDSNVVGLPLAILLNEAGAGSITLCPRSWFHPFFFTEQATTTLTTGTTSTTTPQSTAALPTVPAYSIAGAQTREPAEARLSHPSHQPPLHGTDGTGCTSRERYWTRIQKEGGVSVLEDVSGSLSNSPPRDCERGSARAPDALHEAAPTVQDKAVLPLNEGELTMEAAVRKLTEVTRTADVLFVAVGRPNLVTKDWVKPGAVVVDVGINIVSDGGTVHGNPPHEHRVVGDVAFQDVATRASAVSPVPGGVGPMTISALLHNTLLAAVTRSHMGVEIPALGA